MYRTYRKNIITIICAIIFGLGFFVSAAEPASITITMLPANVTATKKKQDMRPISMKEFFTQYCNTVGYGVPAVYTQIALKIPGVAREEALYGALQRCVYLGFIPNSTVSYKWGSSVSPKFINILVSKNIQIDPDVNEDNTTITRKELNNLINSLPNYQMLMNVGAKSRRGSNPNYLSPVIKAQGFGILSQVYQSFKSDYRSGDEVTDEVLMQGAIKGMTDSLGDIHTEYFPPTQAQQFSDQLNGNFEGIGGYLDIRTSGEVIITSVIKDSPAQKAGLLPQDRIIKIDNYTIQPTDVLATVIAKIKGPAGTVVTLTIQRNGALITIPVTRAKITISMIDYEIKSATPIIKIHTFGWGVAASWIDILKQHTAQISNASKIIIDLRDNPGGSLQEVSDMLSDFIPKDQPVVVTRSRYEEDVIVSAGRKLIDFSSKKIVILVNLSTASASEIMAGTLKDYFPKNVVIIGETTYGKGSVQYLQSFADNSSFKMTIAHWYTGKTKKAIEHIGIKPDIFVELDLDQFKNGTDTQLQAALNQ